MPLKETREHSTAVAAVEWTALVVPGWPRRPHGSWIRQVTGPGPAARGIDVIAGPVLKPGRAYELPLGALVLDCLVEDQGRLVRLLRAEHLELIEIKTWPMRGPVGRRAASYALHRLTPETSARARALEAEVNRFEGRCARCGLTVQPGAGLLIRGEPNRAAHRPGTCPPPPSTVSPNYRAGHCTVCGKWVPAGVGDGELVSAPGGRARYAPVHRRPCPPDALPGPRNRVDAWCANCEHLAAAGTGYWHGGRAHHVQCPQPTGRSWILPQPRGGWDAGDVVLVRLTGPDADQVPPVAPGYRVLDDQYVQFAAVVREVLDRTRRPTARIEVADHAQAAALLAREAAAATAMPDPDPGGHRALWQAEQIGDKSPWVAEITGRHPTYGYNRQFLRARYDYTQANSVGSRGVVLNWTLKVNRVYEAWWKETWNRAQRVFLRATAAGDVRIIDRTEVEAWLNEAARRIAAASRSDRAETGPV